MHKHCLAVFCLPALALAQQPAAPAPAAGGFTKFSWPVPGDVKVVEKSIKGRQSATISYTIRLRRFPDSKDEIRVSYADFKFLMIDGKKADEMPVGVAQVVARAIPDLRVDASGKAIAVVNLDDTIEATLEFVERIGKGSGGALPVAQIRELIKSPAMRGAMEENAKQAWNAWVGAWVGIEPVEAGKPFEGPVELPLTAATPVRGKKRIKNNGEATGFPGHIDLEMDAKYEGDAFVAWLTEQTRRLAPPQMRASMPKVLFESATLEQRVRTLIRKDSLQPARVMTEKTITVKSGAQARRQVERHQYEFSWTKAAKTGNDK